MGAGRQGGLELGEGGGRKNILGRKLRLYGGIWETVPPCPPPQRMYVHPGIEFAHCQKGEIGLIKTRANKTCSTAIMSGIIYF